MRNKKYLSHLKKTYGLTKVEVIEICRFKTFYIPNITDYEQQPTGWVRR